jgi:hypothetical protein
VATWAPPPPRSGRQAPMVPKLGLGRSTEAQVAIAPDGVAQVIRHRASDIQTNTAIHARTLTALPRLSTHTALRRASVRSAERSLSYAERPSKLVATTALNRATKVGAVD